MSAADLLNIVMYWAETEKRQRQRPAFFFSGQRHGHTPKASEYTITNHTGKLRGDSGIKEEEFHFFECKIRGTSEKFENQPKH